jgi:hypothetical protein
MTAGLSPPMAEALQRCYAAGGLRYVRGGYWIEATQDPAPFLRASQAPQMARSDALPWHCSTHMVKNRSIRSVCNALYLADVLEIQRGLYSLTSLGKGEYEALRRAGLMVMERVWWDEG